VLTSELEEIARTVQRLFADRSAARRALEGAAAIDGAIWSNLAELGLLGIALPEDMGGVGLGLAEECVVVEALSAFVAPVPITSTYLAAHVLAKGDAPAALRLANELAAGGTVIGIGLSAQAGMAHFSVSQRDEQSALLTGAIPDLFEGACAEVLLVHGDGTWWAVDIAQQGVTRTELASLDATHRMARLDLAAVRAERIGQMGPDQVLALARTLIAAEALGAGQAALTMTCDYALQRHQFGQPIGRFQAVKQKLAECLIRIEGGRSALWGAIRSMNGGLPDMAAARLAKAEATAGAMFAAAEAVQLHGAIGCTWEHDLHLLMRRAKHCELSLGSPASHRQWLGDRALDNGIASQSRSGGGEGATQLGFVPGCEDEAFIAEFRDWLDENAPRERIYTLRRSDLAARRAWQAELAEAGWVGIHWAKSAGGREASFTQQVLYYSELTRRRLPPLPGNRGLMLVGPTLIAHGSAFHHKLLEPTRRADILWAGGFSERGAGSDLASLRTRGVRDGDELVINGHKIWTSQAQYADWMYALIRTGPVEPKHAGISVVLIPMDSAGVEVRPIRRNNGDFHFNEVFFDEVRVPLANVVGPLNEGWRVNRTTMVGEHLTNFLGSQAAQASTLARVGKAITTREAGSAPDSDLRRRFAEAWATTQIVKLHGLRNVARFTHGENPGAESSISKLVGQENEKNLFEMMIDAMGSEGLAESTWTRAYLSTRASTIGGGTSEIHRNKLAERVLGMPRDPWADEEPAALAQVTSA
jgi:alkylation response protein AidB-like acyl-CoA dehydrogenase